MGVPSNYGPGVREATERVKMVMAGERLRDVYLLPSSDDGVSEEYRYDLFKLATAWVSLHDRPDAQCFLKAADGEPTFTLLGRDRHAPILILLWAAMRGRDWYEGRGDANDLDKASQANRDAIRLIDYARSVLCEPVGIEAVAPEALAMVLSAKGEAALAAVIDRARQTSNMVAAARRRHQPKADQG